MDIKEAVYRRALGIWLFDESTIAGRFLLGDTYDTRRYIKSELPANGDEDVEILSENEVVKMVSYWVVSDDEQMACADFEIDDDFTVEEAIYRNDSISVALFNDEGICVDTIDDLEDKLQLVKDWLKDEKRRAVVSLDITTDYLVESGPYLFIRLDECSADVKLAEDLNEFKEFCHYADLSDWDIHKQTVLQNIDKYGFYIFDGNDVWYYVVQHHMWIGWADVAMAKKSFAEPGAYLFIKTAEADVEVKLAKDLNEFRDFCQYSDYSDWDAQKRDIQHSFETIGLYGVNDKADVWYGIFQHCMWRPEDDDEEFDVTITVE
ncbi:hypothetical protein FACS189491_07850 [Spirochaetia bacterium]|nr:hypothetical protein FACS189491_07850 [Spirochaetia bacterium]